MKKVISIILLVILTNTVVSQWSQYPSGSFGGPLYFVHFLSNIRGFFGGSCYASGQSIIFQTYDGGPSGVVMNTHTSFIFYDFTYINSSTIFLCGSQKNILKSITTWPGWQIKTTSEGNFYAINFPSVNVGYAVGDTPGNISKSTNGGDNWSTIESPTTNTLKSVYFIDDLTGWVCGNNGMILKTTDGCISWNKQTPSTAYNLKKIFFINANTGVVAGSGGVIFKTINGGSSWIIKQSSLTSGLNCIYFYAPNYLWAAGDAGKIIKSSNTGETWFQQNTNNAAVTFNDIYFPSLDTGYAVSTDGYMYKTTNSGGGIVGIVNNEIPVKFELKQNYPNPFNPVTQIEYSLQKPSVVKIIVYDVTGRVIKTLVNEYQNYGTYRIDFDGTGLASGIYVYKITANDFTDTKKMILIK